MPDTFTANLNLTKPEVGLSTDTWGTKLNAGLDSLDAIFAAAGSGTSVGLNVGAGRTLNAQLGTARFADANLFIHDQADTTKILKFEIGGFTTATTRTVTFPNADGTLLFNSRQVATGAGLTGGGDLSADRTIAIGANAVTGSLLFRGSTAGQVLTSNGAGADPTYQSLPGGTAFATSAQYRNNTAGGIALSPEVAWGAAAEVALTYGATITPDMSTFLNAAFTATGNFTLANPTNAKVGQSGYIRIQQDGTGSRTITFGTAYDFPTGMSKALSTAASSVDVLFYTVRSATEIFCSLNKGMA